MNKSILVILLILVAELFMPMITRAQGTTYVSNLDQTPVGDALIGGDAWIAQAFFTGTNSSGYVLNTVQLRMNAASGNPGGFAVSLYSRQSNGSPGSSLGSLGGSDPAVGGLFSYAASGLTLSPHTVYFVVATSLTPIAQGAYIWSAVTGANGFIHGSEEWFIDNGHYNSANGSSWTYFSRQDIFQIGIQATSVPEPSSLALMSLSVSFLIMRLIRRRLIRSSMGSSA